MFTCIQVQYIQSLAFAGFSKGGPENLRIIKTKQKISPLKISPFSCPKFGEDHKKRKRSSFRFSPIFGPKLGEVQKTIKKKRTLVRFCPFLCSNFLPKLLKGGGACSNFAYYSMLIYTIYTGDPKGGPWHQWCKK